MCLLVLKKPYCCLRVVGPAVHRPRRQQAGGGGLQVLQERRQLRLPGNSKSRGDITIIQLKKKFSPL